MLGKPGKSVLVALFLCATIVAGQERQVPGAFRSGVMLIPVDVRVFDRNGQPVTDLTVDDFRVFEDDVRQDIRLFIMQGSDADVDMAGRELSDVWMGDSDLRRTFLIVLGRGRLEGPAKGLDALLSFVRRVPRRDRLAIMAYGKVSNLDTDRGAVMQFVEEYASRHGEIEARLDHWFSGLQVAYGSRETPSGTQRLIDALFATPGIPPTRELPHTGLPGVGTFELERRRILESFDPNNRGERDEEGRYIFILDEAKRRDLQQLYSAIEYLRYVDGEKHIIFVTEEGYSLGAAADRLAAMAGDARVTISPIHTSGLPLNWVYSNGGTQAELVGRSWRQLWAFQDSKAMAEKTGGVGSFYQEAAKGFDEIERRTRFQYVLGYYPSAKDLDGAWRRIRVVVDRPDVAVRHRQGYFAQAATIPTDPTLFLPYVRITAAGMQRESIADIPVGLTLPQIRRNGGETRLTIDVLVSATNLALAQTGDGQVAKLELAVFVGDSQEGVVGETWDRVEQALDERTLARVRREGISRTVTVNVRGEPAYVKAVVYNPVSDRLGSISKSLRRGRR